CMIFILTMNPKISIQHPMSINYSQKSKSLFKKEPIPFIYTAAIPNGIPKIIDTPHGFSRVECHLRMERGWKMVASIHDEIIIEVPMRDVTMETISLFQDIMCNSVSDI